MDKLTDMINISKVNAEKLEKAGINSPGELRRIGSREAIIRVRATSDPGACLSMLYALEGAVQGTRWHNLPDEIKAELKAFHKTL